MNLWIDDIRPAPNDSWIVAKTSKDAFDILKTMCDKITFISFDHDLGGTDTTMPIARWIELRAFGGEKPPQWSVHSANPVGRANLVATLERAELYYEDFLKMQKI